MSNEVPLKKTSKKAIVSNIEMDDEENAVGVVQATKKTSKKAIVSNIEMYDEEKPLGVVQATKKTGKKAIVSNIEMDDEENPVGVVQATKKTGRKANVSNTKMDDEEKPLGFFKAERNGAMNRTCRTLPHLTISNPKGGPRKSVVSDDLPMVQTRNMTRTVDRREREQK